VSKKAPTYFVASISYWAGSLWELEPGTESTRAEAEARVKALRASDLDTPLTARRKYRVMTMTEVKREFGQDWYTRIRPPQG